MKWKKKNNNNNKNMSDGVNIKLINIIKKIFFFIFFKKKTYIQNVCNCVIALKKKYIFFVLNYNK